MNKIYDSLSQNSKATVNSILDKVMGSILDDNDKVNVNMLKAVLEQLNAEKQNLKAQIKADNDAIKAAEKEAAVARGKKLADQLEVGDLVTFIMGAKKFEKEFTLPVQKIGASTITVEFTSEYPTANGEAGKRYIQFHKLVSIQKKDGTVIAVSDAA